MKKIIFLGCILLSACLFSCDLDTEPTDYVSSDIIFENVDNAEKVLNGTWSYIFDTYNTYQNPGWNTLLLLSDAMSNDVAVQPGKYGYIAHYSFTNVVSTSSTTASTIWIFAYRGINNMNSIIAYIDETPGDQEVKARIKAQAYALRGYLYLNLATFYSHSYTYDPEAICVPVYTDPTDSDTEGRPKSKLKDVYARAEEDLLNAYNGIGSYTRNAKHKFDKNVISGVLARLYLQKNEWDKAQQYAAEAHASYSWMSQDAYLEGFNDLGNAEWIWGHGQSTDQSVASYAFNYKDVSSAASYYYSYMADPYFKDFFDEQDIRFQLFEWDLDRYAGGLMYKKFLYRSDKTAPVVLMRKAEMVLIEAEAYAEQGQLSQAIAKLNELREQRGALTPDLSSLSKEDLVEEILIERRKELFGEGFGLSDIQRRNKSVERKAVPTGTLVPGTEVTVKGHTIVRLPDGTDFVPHSRYYLIAIPATEETNNPNLNDY